MIQGNSCNGDEVYNWLVLIENKNSRCLPVFISVIFLVLLKIN